MKIYMAPMEGVTGYVYRRAYGACFYPLDRYVAPFIAPKGQAAGKTGTEGRQISLSTRERRDILPENNQGMCVIPQILTNRWEDFLETAVLLKEFGYEELNLNLGCPSGTVTAKGKGAGFLAFPDRLREFLSRVCAGLEEKGMKLSVKTRLGVEHPEEFERILEIYNQFPLTELILHPRVLKDYYGNEPRLEWFEYALGASRAPVCYNGDIRSPEDLQRLRERIGNSSLKKDLPQRVMLGRGLIRNPGLAGEIMGRQKADIQQLRRFHDLVYEGYREMMGADQNVLFKMKELWSYMLDLFNADSRLAKKLRKARGAGEYQEAAAMIFASGLKEE